MRHTCSVRGHVKAVEAKRLIADHPWGWIGHSRVNMAGVAAALGTGDKERSRLIQLEESADIPASTGKISSTLTSPILPSLM